MRREFRGLLASAMLVLALLTLGASSGVGAVDKCMVINDRLNTTYPWKSLGTQPVQTAIDAAAPGDTLWVRGGCPGPISITKSLTLTGQKIAGFGSAPTIDAATARSSVVHVSGSDVRVQINSLILTRGGTTIHPVATGGGIWNEQATVRLTNVTITDNVATQGGGIYNDHGTVELTNSTIDGNRLALTSNQRYGGGIYTTGGSITLDASTITNNQLAVYGGGIYALDATVVARSSEIGSNLGLGLAGVERGGGIYAGTAFYGQQPGSTVTLTDTKIHDSAVTQLGGGIFGSPATVTLTGSTELTDNDAGDYGGGANASTLILSGNTTIHGNSADDGGGGVRVLYLTMSGNAKIYENSVNPGLSNHGGGILASYGGLLTGCLAGTEGDDGVNVFDNTPDDIYPSAPAIRSTRTRSRPPGRLPS